ncbi:insulin-like growth factor-binding protein 3 [Myripristis murdjan]|uniref:insulin-like growth factor-binding protein 3 n=1 Tax=Myripristis murdjan TaxID=586833 RepID=UPI0011763FA8|nr:insulin-like growth factor-binding protein 3 [Myripristis murdjan]
MPLYTHTLALLLLALSSPWPLTCLGMPSRDCPTCKGNQGQGSPLPHQSTEFSTTSLAIGEPCGVYTLSCANGARCTPPEDEARPLQALLEGRGVCSNTSRINPTERTHTAATRPTPTQDPEKAPCRKLLTTIMKRHDAQLFQSHQDIYMPNCDKRGFFRKKQCWSSRGMQRGNCWCVDENGVPVPSNVKQEGTLICESA